MSLTHEQSRRIGIEQRETSATIRNRPPDPPAIAERSPNVPRAWHSIEIGDVRPVGERMRRSRSGER